MRIPTLGEMQQSPEFQALSPDMQKRALQSYQARYLPTSVQNPGVVPPAQGDSGVDPEEQPQPQDSGVSTDPAAYAGTPATRGVMVKAPYPFATITSDPRWSNLSARGKALMQNWYWNKFEAPNGVPFEQSSTQPGFGERIVGGIKGMVAPFEETAGTALDMPGLVKQGQEHEAEAGRTSYAMPYGESGLKQVANLGTMAFWKQVATHYLPQMLPYIAAGTGVALTATGVGAPAGIAMVGSALAMGGTAIAQTFGQSYQDYLKAHPGDTEGASDHAWKESGIAGLGAAAMEPLALAGLPPGVARDLLSATPAVREAAVKVQQQAIKSAKYVATQILLQGGTGMGQQALSNAIRQEDVDPNQDVTQGLVQAGAVQLGAALPGIVRAVRAAKGSMVHTLGSAEGKPAEGKPGVLAGIQDSPETGMQVPAHGLKPGEPPLVQKPEAAGPEAATPQLAPAPSAPPPEVVRGMVADMRQMGMSDEDIAKQVPGAQAFLGEQPQADESTPTPASAPVQQEIPAAPAESAQPKAAALPKDLAGAKPKYGYGDKLFDLDFASDLDKALYIIASSATNSRRHGDYMEMLRGTFPRTKDTEIRAMGNQVKDAIREQARTSNPEHGPLRIEPVVNPEVGAQAPRQVQSADSSARQQQTTAKRESLGALQGPTGKDVTVATSAGDEVGARYRLAEAGDLVTSHTAEGQENPQYPQALQPRDRGRLAARGWLQKTANRLDPEQLGEARLAETGAPVVGPDGVVESGNGRTMAVQLAYRKGQAGAYKDWLAQNAERFGVKPEDVAAMKQPILVRERTTEMAPDQVEEFTRRANESSVAGMSAVEQAQADAKRLDFMQVLKPSDDGRIDGAGNRAFINRFVTDVAKGKGELLQSDGTVSQAGYTRIRNAILARAYGDTGVLQRIMESTHDDVRNVTAALVRAAPAVAKMRDDMAHGKLDKGMDFTPNLVEAAGIYGDARSEGRSVADVIAESEHPALAGMETEPLSQTTKEFLGIFEQNARSSKAIADTVKQLVDGVEASKQMGLLDEAAKRMEEPQVGDHPTQAASGESQQGVKQEESPQEQPKAAETGKAEDQQRDQEFGTALEAAQAKLKTYAFKLANKNRERAADLLQDTLAKAWEKRGQFDASKGDLVKWARSIMHNLSANEARSFSRRAESRLDTGVDVDRMATAPEQEAQFEKPQTKAQEEADLKARVEAFKRKGGKAKVLPDQETPEQATAGAHGKPGASAEAVETGEGAGSPTESEVAAAAEPTEEGQRQPEGQGELFSKSQRGGEGADVEALRTRAKEMLGDKGPAVEVAHALTDGAAGEYEPATNTIRVAFDAADPKAVLDHEAMHAARSMLLSQLENRVLESKFREGGKWAQRVEKLLSTDAERGQLGSVDERIAYGFQLWRQGKFEPDTVVGRFFSKLNEGFERLRNWVQGAGFKSAADVFRALDRGDMAERTPRETGPFGPIYPEFTGRPKEAIEHLLNARQGEVPGALHNPELGPIDLVWGNDKYGLQHILARGRPESLLRNLPEIVEKGVVSDDPRSSRKRITYQADRAVVRLDWDDKSKHWLVTAYDLAEEQTSPRREVPTRSLPQDDSTPSVVPESQGEAKKSLAERAQKFKSMGPRDRRSIPDQNQTPEQLAETVRQAKESPEESADYTKGVNTSRLNMGTAARNRVMDAVSTAFGGFEKERGGTISWKEQIAAADNLIREGKVSVDSILAEEPGKAITPAEAVARRSLLENSTQWIIDHVDQAHGNDAERAAFLVAQAKHAMLQARVTASESSAGRVLNVRRMGGRTTDAVARSEAPQISPAVTEIVRNEAKVREAQGKALTDLMGKFQAGKMDFDTYTDAIRELKDPAKVQSFIQKAWTPRWYDYPLEAWINSLLSNPQILVKKTMTDAIARGLQVPETAVAAGIGKLLGTQQRVYAGEASARFNGAVQASLDGMKAMAHAFKTGEGAFGEGFHRDAIPGVFGKLVRTPGRAIEAVNAYAQTVAYRQEVNALAYRQAMQEGLKGEAFVARFNQLAANPTEEMHIAATDTARYLTFTNDLGPLGKKIQQVVNSHPLFKIILPFYRVPVNLLKFGGERTPLALAMPGFWKDLKAGDATRDMALSRLAIGTAATVSLAALASQGIITGDGPTDPGARNVWRRTGPAGGDRWAPRSVLIGGHYISYGNIEPIGAIAGGVASFVETYHLMKDEEADRVASSLVAAVAKTITSRTYLTGLADFVNALTDPERKGQSWLGKLAGSMVPSVVASINREIDPNLRDARTVVDSVKARIPGFAQTLPVRLDIAGEPITWGGAVGPMLLSPLYLSHPNADAVANELADLKVSIKMPPRNINFNPLDGDQYAMFSHLAGQQMWSMLSDVMNRPGWEEYTPDVKKKYIERIFSRAHEIARIQMKRAYPDLIRPPARGNAG